MKSIGLNQTTDQESSTMELLEIAASLECVGVELRNDQSGPMFDGKGAIWVRDEAAVRGPHVPALIESLGFANSSLHLKADAMAVLDDMGRPDCFALIHDTFHHDLSGETAVFADATRIVHISGVDDPFVAPADMTGAHRGLVGSADCFGNIAQIKKLQTQGSAGPFSYEAFAADVHDMINPTQALSASTAFINSQIANLAA